MNNKDHNQHQFIYSPPHQSKELNEPDIPIQVPTLTPPHSSTATHHHQIRSDSQTVTNNVGDAHLMESVSTVAAKEPFSASPIVATKDVQPSSQHLPPRKRIQSLKKQFTKPNLSVPVASQSLIHDSSTTIMDVSKDSSASKPTRTTSERSSSISTTAKTIKTPATPSTATASAYPTNTRSRSPSPILDIENDSGDTTETDDDDIQQRRKASTGDAVGLEEGTSTGDVPSGPKQAVIIQQQPTQPNTIPSSKTTQKLKEPSRKHWHSSSLQSKSDLPADQQQSLGFDTSDIQDTIDEKPKKTKKKAFSQSTDEASLRPMKIKKPSGRPPKSRTKKPGALYCICQTPYDAPRFMIACDRCDQWFHGECIGISESEGEFIDLYFCDVCGKETGKSTSWKSRCGNPACSKAARISSHQGYLSKYCSHNCGMQVARARLELTEMKRRQQTDTPTDNTTNIPQLTINKQRQSRVSSNAEKEDHHRLEQLRKQKLRALDMIRMTEQKQAFLGMTEQQLRGSDICGFDPRLVWDDQLWMKVQDVVASGDESIIMLQYDDDSDDGDTVSAQQSIDQNARCQLLRKECRQHQQWAKLLELEMKQERNEQLHIIKMLEKEKHAIKNRMRQRRNEVDLADSLGNGTISY